MGKLIWMQFKNSHYSVIVQVEPKSAFVFLKTQMPESSLLLIFAVLNMLSWEAYISGLMAARSQCSPSDQRYQGKGREDGSPDPWAKEVVPNSQGQIKVACDQVA